MNNLDHHVSAAIDGRDEIEKYLIKCKSVFGELFSQAKSSNEIEFAFSLCPEFRPFAISTFVPAQNAVTEYREFITNEINSPIKIRNALACYSHIAESSGLWEIVVNMISVKNGLRHDVYPFSDLVKDFGKKDQAIDPNANKVLRSVTNFSKAKGETALYEILNTGFDSDVRNGFAHADYVLLTDGICFGSRYKHERIIGWSEFSVLFSKAMAIYDALIEIREEFLSEYFVPKLIEIYEPDKKGTMSTIISIENSSFSISQTFKSDSES